MWDLRFYSDDSKRRFEQVQRDFAGILQRSKDLEEHMNSLQEEWESEKNKYEVSVERVIKG